MITVGSDFSGVGAFNQALIRLGIQYKEIFTCDMDKYARQTFIHNYGEPEYYPTNVYDREIPSKSIDIYMTSPPCQAFSLAGKRLGKDDKRGILFFNSHEFIQVNKPRYFIFENVKGLLSDDGGKTFSEWVNMLGGKSVNGVPVIFPYEDSVPYHLYWKVLNAKHHGVPQNRERVFLIGIRDDYDNTFRFPIEEHLNKRLKDVLENDVADKYFLSENQINQLIINGISDTDSDLKCIGNTQPSANGMNGNVFDSEGISPTLSTNKGEGIKIKEATSKGYEEATEGDSINFSVPNSETRRGRVGKGVAQTLDTGCQQGVLHKYQKEIEESLSQDICTAIDASYYKGFGVRQGKCRQVVKVDYKIRRLTPRECFRLMDFPDTFTWQVSDSQAYKQAGNSIVVNVLYKILKNLNL
jgi:DNA (cytosine-5)-methyltransferase 1